MQSFLKLIVDFAFQLVASTLLFVAVNIAGIFSHFPSKSSQRQAFMETRQCVESRLNIQRENQQQVFSL